MKHLLPLAAALALAAPAFAQNGPQGDPSPNEIVAAAPASDWVAIPAEDLLVMTLAPDAEGNPREVIIQLMPAPFSQGWVHNIKLLARSGWYDNISVNRVQDNYVVQWGDPNYDNPEATGEAKPLPEGLKVMVERDYTANASTQFLARATAEYATADAEANARGTEMSLDAFTPAPCTWDGRAAKYNCFEYPDLERTNFYSRLEGYEGGWPLASDSERMWPTHCYGMVGVGRSYSPDTGSGAELYTVIGHAPRHLDRNVALVGRIIEGMEHLSSLPRGKGELGFYAADEVGRRTPILSIRVASDIPQFPQPTFEYLSTESESFARYAEARANRRDPFFIVPAGGADICNIPVPVRRVASD